jgi:hypothetical protein
MDMAQIVEAAFDCPIVFESTATTANDDGFDSLASEPSDGSADCDPGWRVHNE